MHLFDIIVVNVIFVVVAPNVPVHRCPAGAGNRRGV